jgi:hypothetical protein
MTVDLEVDEVEGKVLTSLASVTWITGAGCGGGNLIIDEDACLAY